MSVEPNPLERRLTAPGPKRILALDGSGLGAALSAGMLEAVEAQLRRLSGRLDFRLCDYFDLIGGVSTGAILATGLALGGTAAQAGEFFKKVAAHAFLPEQRPGAPRFDAARLEEFFSDALGDLDFSASALRTGLTIFTAQPDEDVVEPIGNNPRDPLWNAAHPAREFLLRGALLASLGAPRVYETAHLALDASGRAAARYIDASAAGAGNPSFALLKMVALTGAGLSWPSGPDRILMLSVGGGVWPRRLSGDRRLDAVDSMMRHAVQDVTATMQSLATTPRPWGAPGAAEGTPGLPLSPVPLLHYQRMDVRLDSAGLSALDEAGDPQALGDRADEAGMERLRRIGAKAGRLYFEDVGGKRKTRWDRAIFPRRFDPPDFTGGPAGPPKSKLEALGRAWNE